MWNNDFWVLPLAVFIPSVLMLLAGRWAINSVMNALKSISKNILEWHGSEESYEAHDKMFRKFLQTDHFREKLNDHVKNEIGAAITPLNLKMDLLDKNIQLANANLTKEVREQIEKFKNELLLALAQRREPVERRENRDSGSYPPMYPPKFPSGSE